MDITNIDSFWKKFAVGVVLLVVIGWGYDRLEDNKMKRANQIVQAVRQQYAQEVGRFQKTIQGYEARLKNK